MLNSQHAVISLLGNTEFPAPKTIACDATSGNQIESEYIVQYRIPGVTLEGTFHDIETNKKEHIVDQVFDLLAEMENVQFLMTTCGFRGLPDALIVNGSDPS